MANIQLCKSDRLLFKLLCCVLVQTGCGNARVDSCVDGCFSLSLQTSPAVCCCCPWAGAHPKLSRCPHRARGPAVSAPTSTRCSCWTSQKLWTAWVQISAACDFCLIFLPFFSRYLCRLSVIILLCSNNFFTVYYRFIWVMVSNRKKLRWGILGRPYWPVHPLWLRWAFSQSSTVYGDSWQLS